LEFVELRPHEIIEPGIQLYLVELSIFNIKYYLDILGVRRPRTAIHNLVQKPIDS
jgi:hypothetical protein